MVSFETLQKMTRADISTYVSNVDNYTRVTMKKHPVLVCRSGYSAWFGRRVDYEGIRLSGAVSVRHTDGNQDIFQPVALPHICKYANGDEITIRDFVRNPTNGVLQLRGDIQATWIDTTTPYWALITCSWGRADGFASSVSRTQYRLEVLLARDSGYGSPDLTCLQHLSLEDFVVIFNLNPFKAFLGSLPFKIEPTPLSISHLSMSSDLMTSAPPLAEPAAAPTQDLMDKIRTSPYKARVAAFRAELEKEQPNPVTLANLAGSLNLGTATNVRVVGTYLFLSLHGTAQSDILTSVNRVEVVSDINDCPSKVHAKRRLEVITSLRGRKVYEPIASLKEVSRSGEDKGVPTIRLNYLLFADFSSPRAVRVGYCRNSDPIISVTISDIEELMHLFGNSNPTASLLTLGYRATTVEYSRLRLYPNLLKLLTAANTSRVFPECFKRYRGSGMAVFDTAWHSEYLVLKSLGLLSKTVPDSAIRQAQEHLITGLSEIIETHIACRIWAAVNIVNKDANSSGSCETSTGRNCAYASLMSYSVKMLGDRGIAVRLVWRYRELTGGNCVYTMLDTPAVVLEWLVPDITHPAGEAKINGSTVDWITCKCQQPAEWLRYLIINDWERFVYAGFPIEGLIGALYKCLGITET